MAPFAVKVKGESEWLVRPFAGVGKEGDVGCDPTQQPSTHVISDWYATGPDGTLVTIDPKETVGSRVVSRDPSIPTEMGKVAQLSCFAFSRGDGDKFTADGVPNQGRFTEEYSEPQSLNVGQVVSTDKPEKLLEHQ